MLERSQKLIDDQSPASWCLPAAFSSLGCRHELNNLSVLTSLTIVEGAASLKGPCGGGGHSGSHPWMPSPEPSPLIQPVIVQVLEYTTTAETRKAGAADASRCPGCRRLDTGKGTLLSCLTCLQRVSRSGPGRPLPHAPTVGCNLTYIQLQGALQRRPCGR